MAGNDDEPRDDHGRWTTGGQGGKEDTAQSSKEHAAKVAGDYKPLPGLPQVPMKLADGWYTPGPNAAIQDAAKAYAQSAGIENYERQDRYHNADPEEGAKIAQAFEQMKHDPDNPEVKASYDALAKETIAQWKELEKTGLNVDWIKPGQKDPYADTPRSAERDVSENNHWWGFPTEGGFGSDASLRDNPLLQPAGFKIGGKDVLVNDVFRLVRDMFGHIKEGYGFSPSGEDNAWRSHMAMYSPLAQRALTTETRGQSSWVNYGPHGESNRSLLYGSKAVSSNTGGSGVIYAPQKIGLMPKWTMKR
jgi:hypothetical protein